MSSSLGYEVGAGEAIGQAAGRMFYGVDNSGYDEDGRDDAEDARCCSQECDGPVIDKDHRRRNKDQKRRKASDGPATNEAQASGELAGGVDNRDTEQV